MPGAAPAPLPAGPSTPQDQRTASTCIFGAICPSDAKAAGRSAGNASPGQFSDPLHPAALQHAGDGPASGLHLARISGGIAAACHALLLPDQAGWHLSHHLVGPANITLLPLPAKCPELSPVENIWQFRGDTWLSNRTFTGQGDITDHCCNAWNRLKASPSRSTSIGMGDWAHGL